MCKEKVNKRSLAIAAVAVILFSTTLISITASTADSAFARHERNVRCSVKQRLLAIHV